VSSELKELSIWKAYPSIYPKNRLRRGAKMTLEKPITVQPQQQANPAKRLASAETSRIRPQPVWRTRPKTM